MSKADPTVRLRHMRDYARKALEMTTARERQDLDKNEMLRLALTHLVELVGEAAAQVPRDQTEKYPRIPWAEVVGMRHRLIHGYDLVDYDRAPPPCQGLRHPLGHDPTRSAGINRGTRPGSGLGSLKRTDAAQS